MADQQSWALLGLPRTHIELGARRARTKPRPNRWMPSCRFAALKLIRNPICITNDFSAVQPVRFPHAVDWLDLLPLPCDEQRILDAPVHSVSTSKPNILLPNLSNLSNFSNLRIFRIFQIFRTRQMIYLFRVFRVFRGSQLPSPRSECLK